MAGAYPDEALRLTRRHLVVAVVCAFAFGVDLSEVSLGGALSTIFTGPPYGLRGFFLGSLVAAVYVGSVAGAPLGAWLWGRLGYRWTFALLMVWLALTSALAALSPTAFELTGARLLSGLSLGAYPPLMVAYIREVAPARRRGFLLSLTCALAYLAPPLCLIVVRTLTMARPLGIEGWRWLFAGVTPLCLAAAAAYLWLPEGTSGSSVRSATSDAVGNGGRRRSRFDRRIILLVLLYFLIPWASVGFPIVTGPALLARGLSLSSSLGYISAAAAGPFVSTLLAGAFLDRLRRQPVMLACAGLMLAGVGAFFIVQAGPGLAAIVIAISALSSTYLAVMTLLGAELFRPDQAPGATAWAWSLNRVGSAIAPIVLLALMQDNQVATVVGAISFALIASMAVIACTLRMA